MELSFRMIILRVLTRSVETLVETRAYDRGASRFFFSFSGVFLNFRELNIRILFLNPKTDFEKKIKLLYTTGMNKSHGP